MTGRLATKKGLFYCVLSYRDKNGEWKQKWIPTGLTERGNKKAAQQILQQTIMEYCKLYPDDNIPTKMKANDSPLWIDWLKNYITSIANNLSPSQREIVEESYMRSFLEFWGKTNLRLIQIKTQDILDFYNYMRKTRGVKNNTLRRYASVIRPALKKAYKEKLINENPYDFMPTLKKEKVTPKFYDQTDMEKLFNVIKGHKLELAFKFLAYYGVRRSELVGIKWDSIDFINKTITINHKVLVVKKEIIVSETMKTASSTRTLPLIPKIEKELLNWQIQIQKNKDYFGKNYNNKYADFVFTNENGDLILPDHLTHSFAKVLKRNNLKYIRLHDLRHSCASIMLANGVQMKQIQEWLGHSNFSTTADVYSHLDYTSKIESAKKIANALNGKERPIIQDNNNKIKLLENKMQELGINSIDELLSLLSQKR